MNRLINIQRRFRAVFMVLFSKKYIVITTNQVNTSFYDLDVITNDTFGLTYSKLHFCEKAVKKMFFDQKKPDVVEEALFLIQGEDITKK